MYKSYKTSILSGRIERLEKETILVRLCDNEGTQFFTNFKKNQFEFKPEEGKEFEMVIIEQWNFKKNQRLSSHYFKKIETPKPSKEDYDLFMKKINDEFPDEI